MFFFAWNCWDVCVRTRANTVLRYTMTDAQREIIVSCMWMWSDKYSAANVSAIGEFESVNKNDEQQKLFQFNLWPSQRLSE